jgi:hypothetical protein
VQEFIRNQVYNDQTNRRALYNHDFFLASFHCRACVLSSGPCQWRLLPTLHLPWLWLLCLAAYYQRVSTRHNLTLLNLTGDYSANAHTSTPFYIVINPASGPGSPNTQPDANYQACIPKLKATSNPNVKVIGYVSTSWGNRAEADVNRDVATYKGWGSAYRPNGIFYDEGATSSSLASLYARYASNARSQLGGTVSTPYNLPK